MQEQRTKVSQLISEFIAEKRQQFEQMSDTIWDYAEVKFEEEKSCKLQREFLEQQGFKIVWPCAGLDTAFMAEFGSGKPIIGILGEYDALPGLEQEADSARENHSEPASPGHGCGHNLLGTAGAEAVCAVKKAMEETGLMGTVRYYGCPAEEGGGGKAAMIRNHAFDDVDIALSWHPGFDSILYSRGKAACSYNFEFKGISAHAGIMPEAGRSALDAAELMNIGTQFLREHIKKSISIQYAFLDAGGKSSNIVPDHAMLSYTVRAESAVDMMDTLERLKQIAAGAAMMTQTTALEPTQEFIYANVLPNKTLLNIVSRNIEKHFPISYTAEELELAREFQLAGTQPEAAYPIVKKFNPSQELPARITTDFGDVSWVLPSAAFCVPTCAVGTRVHNWAMTAQGKTSYAHKGMHVAAAVIAESAMEIFADPGIVNEAKGDLEAVLNGKNYLKLFQ